MLDFSKNYFELFGVPVAFEIDADQLENQYRSLQSTLHPDRYVQASDQERRLAVQGFSYVNEAYETLRNQRLRARYLLELAGVEFNDERDTSSDPVFLMQQMEYREQMERAGNAAESLGALDAVAANIRQEERALYDQFEALYSQESLQEAKDCVLKMKFFHRLLDEVTNQQAKIEDELF